MSLGYWEDIGAVQVRMGIRPLRFCSGSSQDVHKNRRRCNLSLEAPDPLENLKSQKCELRGPPVQCQSPEVQNFSKSGIKCYFGKRKM